MSQDNLQFGVIFTADNTELIAASRENVAATGGYATAAKSAGKSANDLGSANALAAKEIAATAPAIRNQAAALGQLNTQSGASVAATGRVASSQTALAAQSSNSTKQMQIQGAGAGQLRQALALVAVESVNGAGSFTNLATQGSQAAAVLSQMDGGANKFTRSLGGIGVAFGGWVIAIDLAITAGVALYDMFTDNSNALAELKPLTNSLADAQSVLGEVFDLTTGKLKTQNEILKINALMMATKYGIEGRASLAESQKVLAGGLNNTAWLQDFLGVDVAGTAGQSRQITDLLKKVTSGKIDSVTAYQTIRDKPEEFFAGMKSTQAEFLQALGDRLVAIEKIRIEKETLDGLKRGQLASEFLKPEKDKKPSTNLRDNRSQAQVLNDFTSELEARGVAVISKYRSAEKQNGYFKQGLTPLDGYKRLSRHQTSQAVDVDKRTHDDQKARDAAQAAGLKGFEIVTESGGRKHYEWSGSQKKGAADVAGSEAAYNKEIAAAEKLKNEVEQLANFGSNAADKIGQMRAQFDTVPRDVDNANKSIDDINELMAELQKKQPPGFKVMIADAQKLAPLIQESLRRPILEMLSDQERQIGIGSALLQNDQSRADAMQVTQQLMQRFGVDNEAALATDLARRGITGDQIRNYYRQLDVLKEQGRALDVLREKQQVNLQFLGDFQGSLRDTVRGVLGGEGLGALADGINGIFEGYLDGLASQLSDSLFGDIFRDQQDKVTGVGKVEAADEELAAQVEEAGKKLVNSTTAVVTEIDKTKTALGGLVDTLEAVSGKGEPEVAIAGAVTGAVSGTVGTAPQPADTGELQVVANRTIDKTLKSTLQQLLEGLFGADSKAATQLSTIIPQMFRAAAEGQIASGTLGSLGLKQSKLGSLIGGAAGKAIGPALGKLGGTIGAALGPLGGFIGGALGGTLGGLFGRSKTGSAGLSFTDGQLASGAVGGNNRELQGRAGNLVNNVGSSLTSIAEQLGGYLSGRAAVSIGYDKKGKVVVDPTGRNRTKGSGVQNFGKDGEEAARAFATLDALRDGAVAGLSGKVAQALRSSTDLDKAIREAVKVDEIEQILAGFGGASKRVFVDFERQAKERLRIAGAYGFDLVKLEEQNAKQRNKLLNDSIDQATGGLKALLEDLVSGEKAPGTLLDRRSALLAQKAELEKQAPTDADAAEKLANVLEQLYQVSLDAFGTAGAQFAGDRTGIKSTAEAIIAEATAQLTGAQNQARQNAGTDSASTDALLGNGNAILGQIQKLIDEGNGQSAQLINLMAKLAASGSLTGASDQLALNNAYQLAAGFNFGPNLR